VWARCFATQRSVQSRRLTEDLLARQSAPRPRSQTARLKERFHRKAIAAWAGKFGRAVSDAWETREACIAALAANSSIELTRTGKPARAARVRR
jgi:hypothetical protein